ncbi:hypothetical protein SDC9_182576 [bioreactor metagenome]|uniref:Uncharacterized protein n=1 Tax=bioreactor metagenome TaxID=1076179 RepID=A0A645H9M9_9ZZZZ
MAITTLSPLLDVALAAGRVAVLLLITAVVRSLLVLNGFRAGSVGRGATTGVSTRLATTGAGGGGGGVSALMVKTTV